MLFKEYTYSVLIASSSAKFVTGIMPLLPENEFAPIETAKSAGEAQRKLLERDFDIVLINTPLTDDFGIRLALDVVADSKAGALMFVKGDIYDEVCDKVCDYGVFTLSKPASSQIVHQLLKNMYAAQERFRRMEKKAATLQEKMEEIRVINHAKWVLIQNMGLTESEAHRLIEKQAMDTRQSKLAVAEGIIRTYGG